MCFCQIIRVNIETFIPKSTYVRSIVKMKMTSFNYESTQGMTEMQSELERNWSAFEKARQRLEAEHLGRIVLLHDGKIVAVYNDSGDAYDIGCEKYGLGNFSIETIGSRPKSLGFFTMHVHP